MSNKSFYHLNEYSTNRVYGGPEEGGWWYDCGRYLRCHGVFTEEALARQALSGLLQAYLPSRQAGLAKPDSVACTGYPVLRVEAHEGRDYPATAPCYA